MSGTITFGEIPLDYRVPGTLVEIRPEYSGIGVSAWPARVLIIGQMLAGQPGLSNVAVRVTRADQAVGRYGAGSQLAQMVAAFFAANGTTEVWMMALADPTGAKATATITISGAATANGTLVSYVAGIRAAASVLTTDTPTTAAVKVAAAVNAIPNMPVVASPALGVVTLTAKHTGVIGNDIDLRLNRAFDETTPAGLTVALSAAKLAAGTGSADLASGLAAVVNEWFTDIVVQDTDSTSMTALAADLARRYAATGRLDAHAYAGRGGTFGTLSSFGAAQNSPFASVIGANRSPTPPWIWAASLAGAAAFQLTNDPARQLRGLTLPGVLAPDAVDCAIDSERDSLLRDGISTWNRDSTGGVVLERVITLYQKTTLGVDDTAWLDIMIPKTLSRIRYDWTRYLSLTYPRSKLADDGSAAAEADPSVVTPRRLHSSWAARCALYARNGWIESEAETVAASLFQRNASDRNRVDSRQQVQVIGNLMVLAAALEFRA